VKSSSNSSAPSHFEQNHLSYARSDTAWTSCPRLTPGPYNIPPAQQQQLGLDNSAGTISTISNWLNEPVRYGSYNNIASFCPIEVRQSSANQGELDENDLAEDWSMGYQDCEQLSKE
jgi:hypothetical protein